MRAVLEKICDQKKVFVKERRTEYPESYLEKQIAVKDAPRRFIEALNVSSAAGFYSLIAEIKKASPSRGLIREVFKPAELAVAYKMGGATCLSVLTDGPYFQGDNKDLEQAKAAVDLPILRKDFMIDPYQILESRAIGADCVLLIMAAVSDPVASLLHNNAQELGMYVLVEVHDENEMERALALQPKLIGINNRNLKTLKVDLGTTARLAPKVPEDVILVSESGIHLNTDLKRISAWGINCFLVGESLMRQADVEKAVRDLLGNNMKCKT